jgi:hypothetical protein
MQVYGEAVAGDVAARQRQTYDTLLALDDAPFIVQRPAMFSPAAAAQDEANLRGSFGRFAQILLPLEYTDWVQESRAHVQSCYLGAWTSLNKVSIRGRRALEFLSRTGLNDLSGSRPGRSGITSSSTSMAGWLPRACCAGSARRSSSTPGSCDWLVWQFSQGSWDADVADNSPETGNQGYRRGPAVQA